MFFSSSSSSFSSEDGSELSSDRSSAIFEESEASFVPHDEDLENSQLKKKLPHTRQTTRTKTVGFFFCQLFMNG